MTDAKTRTILASDCMAEMKHSRLQKRAKTVQPQFADAYATFQLHAGQIAPG